MGSDEFWDSRNSQMVTGQAELGGKGRKILEVEMEFLEDAKLLQWMVFDSPYTAD